MTGMRPERERRGLSKVASWVAPGAALCLVLSGALSHAQVKQRYFGLVVRDADGGAAIPGARLETTNGVVLTTDVSGTAAFYEPGLANDDVFFFVTHPTYEHAADFLSSRGRAVRVTTDAGVATFTLSRIFDGGVAPSVTHAEELIKYAVGVPRPSEFFSIRFVDSRTGRGVPAVELRTDAGHYLTDSAGYVAFYERTAMGVPTHFSVFSHGYHFADGGISLTPSDGGAVVLPIDRDNVAERLYRVTGQGIYRESTLLGLPVPLAKPNLNGRVMGSDSVLSTLYQGRPFFAWGDTGQPSYPLGNFYATAARSRFFGDGGLLPEVGIDLEYFVQGNGFVKAVAPQTDAGNGPVWLGGLWTLPDDAGTERLFATFVKLRSGFDVLYRGLMRFDDAQSQFVRIAVFDAGMPIEPTGVPERVVEADGAWLYFNDGVRVKADIASTLTFDGPGGYQSFTAVLRDGGVARDGNGRAQFAFRHSTPPLAEFAQRDGKVDAGEGLWEQMRDADTFLHVPKHTTVPASWNPYRQRFVRIIQQWFGATSFLGELFFSEGDTPMGPWVWHKKVLTHTGYSFYNPRHHPFFNQDGGQVIYFEGTYTNFLTGLTPTPRYDYNQLMYRLNLSDDALVLPVPVYQVGDTFLLKQKLPPGLPAQAAPFLAYDRNKPGLVGVWRDGSPCAPGRYRTDSPAARPPDFWALPVAVDAGTDEVVPLWACGGAALGERLSLSGAGDCMNGRRVAKVFRNPLVVEFPVDSYLRSPLAWAGPSQCVRTSTSSAQVTLSAAQSRAVGSSLSSYGWSTPAGARSGQSVSLALPVGLHDFTLTVTAADGRTDSTTVEVEVATEAVVDGGEADAGASVPDAGNEGVAGTATLDGGSTRGSAPTGCGCGAVPSTGVVALALAFMGRKRARRVPLQ